MVVGVTRRSGAEGWLPERNGVLTLCGSEDQVFKTGPQAAKEQDTSAWNIRRNC